MPTRKTASHDTKLEFCSIFSIRLSATFFGLMFLAACDDAATFDARRALPVETQRTAFAECAKEMGFLAGWLHLHKLKSRDGLLHIEGSDGSGVTVGEGLRLNQCAWAKLDALNASN